MINPNHGTAPRAAPAGGDESASPGARAILIAEDEESIAGTLAMVIEEMGYAPIVAPNGREALDLARARRPLLVITDLMMPVMDGAALIAALRADAARNGHRPPLILLMTAANRSRANELAPDAYIPKPFDLATLEHAVLRLLAEA